MSKVLVEKRNLNPEQIQAVEHGEGPLLIIAGAGTGKTTVVTERIKHIVTSDLAKPSEILALTFTEKAAREMEERVDVAMPYGYTQMWISTFHSFCDRVLRNESVHIGLTPNYKLLSDTDVTMLLRKYLFAFDLDYFRPLGNPTKFISGMMQHFSRLRDEDVSPEQYLEWVKTLKIKYEAKSEPVSTGKAGFGEAKEEFLELKKYEELAKAYEKYEELKIKEGFLDFSNLIGNTLQLFRERPNILKNYQNQFKFILVDEFQDTNVAQNQLLLLLAKRHNNITVVGDDDQSVYKFRGAAVSNIIQFRKNFPKAKVIVLAKNYRSTQEILDKSYRLIQHNNPDRLEIKENINKHLFSMRKIRGEKVVFLHADRVENEADQVAKEIKRLHDVISIRQPAERDPIGKTDDKGDFSSSSDWIRNDKLSWSDVAILVRANNHGQPFMQALTRHAVPYQFLGPGQLFRQPEIKELICYLQVLINFEDSAALFKVLSMEYFGISAKDLISISNLGKRNSISLFEACEIATDGKSRTNVKLPQIENGTKNKISEILTIIKKHLSLITRETAGQLLFYFLQDCGILKNIINFKTHLDEKKAGNITKFFNKLKTYEAEHEDAFVITVLDWIMLSMELGESPIAADSDWTENDAVNILTIHSAKGLEFKVVFLVNLVAQRFPTTQRSEQIPIPDELIKEELPEGDYHLEEERRLFYVGMTRARDLLYLTAANFYGEGKREKKISPFVPEALGEAVTTAQVIANVNQLSLLDWKKVAQQRNPSPSADGEGSHAKTPVTYLSYSQIETFKTCPLHYKLRYILNIPTPPSPALSFGATMHLVLKEAYMQKIQKKKITKSEFLDLLEKNWLREGYQDKQYESEMKKRGQKYLAEYYEKEFVKSTKPLLLEQKFSIPVKNKNRFLKIGGRIDRVDDRGKGVIEIIDYKTGRLPTKRDVDANLQMSIYGLAATEIGELPFNKLPEKVILSLYYFDSQEKISTTRTKEQLEIEKEKIVELAKEIEQSDFKCSGNQLCKTCEYKMFCG